MILSTAFRYSFSRFNRHRARIVRTMILLSLSVVVFMTTLSSMSALQKRRFDGLRAVKCFDITVTGCPYEIVSELYPDCSVFVYKQETALVNGMPMNIRYVDSSYDGEVKLMFGDLSSLAVPYTIYAESGLGDVSVSTFSHDGTRRLPVSRKIPVSGLYYTSSQGDFDRYHVLSQYSNAPSELEEIVAVKGSDDTRPLRDAGYMAYETWKEKESTLYAAFMLEKIMMGIVVSVLFVIVLLSLRQQIGAFLKAKRTERAELLILGLGRRRTEAVFTLSFLIVVAMALAVGAAASLPVIRLSSFLLSGIYGVEFSPSFEPGTFLILSVAMLFFTFVLSFAALFRERRRDILEVLRNE